jgi:small subunit ribosomal protein S20
MANIKSSKKSIRKIAKLTARNKAERSRLKTISKKMQKLQAGDDAAATMAVTIEYMSIVDKAGKHGVWHHNKVNRVKSRLTKVIAACSSKVPADKPAEDASAKEA